MNCLESSLVKIGMGARTSRHRLPQHKVAKVDRLVQELVQSVAHRRGAQAANIRWRPNEVEEVDLEYPVVTPPNSVSRRFS